MNVTLGIDIGGTKIAAGLVQFPEGTVLKEQRLATNPLRDSATILGDIQVLAQSVAADTKIAGVGVAICELVNKNGEITSNNCLPWKTADLCEPLKQFPNLTIEADVRAAALAEHTLGAGRGHHPLLYITIGTGISACLIIEGKPYLGAHGETGTFASNRLHHGSSALTLEQIASGSGLLQRAQASGLNVDSARALVELSAAGNTQARELLNNATATFGSHIATLVNTLDPAALVVGGGLGASEHFWSLLQPVIRAGLYSRTQQRIPLLPARFGPQSALIGAALVAYRKL